MAATIKIKNSSTASAVPTSSDLVQGELAVNVTDKRIFTENASGTVVELGTNPSTLTVTAGVTIQGITVGKGAGSVSTNTAVGASALAANTTGAGNTGIGNSALSLNTSANYGTAVGYLALRKNTTGAENTAYGVTALVENTTGSYNVAVGRDALGANTTASRNTAVGYQAGYTMSTAASGVFVGYQSGYSNTGASNVYVGDSAGYSASSGTTNTFIGNAAGYSVTTGSKNTIIGNYSGNQGGLDIRTSSNYIVLSDGDGNPSGFCDTANGWHFGLGTSSYSGTVNLHGYATSGYGPCVIGITGSAASPTGRWYAGSNSYIKGGTAYDTYCVAAGAAASGGVNLSSGATSWASASDARLKTVTGTYENALSDIAQIEAVKFTWKDDAENKPQVGVIAQSVQAVVPEAIDMIRVSKEDETDYLSVKYTELIPLMIASIQELKAYLDATKAELAALKGQA